MPIIGTLIPFVNGTVADADEVNQNFASIKEAFNESAVLTDVAKTISVAHTWSAAQAWGIAQQFHAGAVGAPGVAVGEAASGLYRIAAANLGLAINGTKRVDFSAAGVSVVGNLAASGDTAITGAATVGGTLGVSGAATLASAAISGAATVGGTLGVTGAATFQALSSTAITEGGTLLSSKYAASGHNHEGVYATAGHNHTGVYAPISHSQAASTITSGTFAAGAFIFQSTVTATEFLESSLLETKCNVQPWGGNPGEVIDSLDIVQFQRVKGLGKHTQIGIIADYTDRRLTGSTGRGWDVASTLAVAVLELQDVRRRLSTLEAPLARAA